MARLHLLEIEDQAWCPRWLRDAGTAYLRRSMETTAARLLAPKLAGALRKAGSTQIVDLCSGGAGPIPALLQELRQEGLDASATLTDAFPNLPALEAAAEEGDGRIGFSVEPIDATDVPPNLAGLRTLFNGFHHFRPADAQRILQSAVDAGSPIGVFEFVSRSPAALLTVLFAPLAVWLLMPTVKPRRASWLFFTYLVPIVPLFVLWDGLVSCLRVYSMDELQGLVDRLQAPGYGFEIGRIRIGPTPLYITYLLGHPASAPGAHS